MSGTVTNKVHPRPDEPGLTGQSVVFLRPAQLARPEAEVDDALEITPAEARIETQSRGLARRDRPDPLQAAPLRLVQGVRDAAEIDALADGPDGKDERQAG